MAKERRGLGRRGTSSLTRWVLQRAENAYLLVNQENDSAQRMYETLGYLQDHESRTIFVAP